ncbi:CPBP family glutamic-type intramembrane protease [Arsenicitalea aurantiaca]|uniref:CPBP family glutamic-type intramembrane protease n=1 Tax=Arsenicitalea aurantiaca TaxID=1783274 RepID=UPI001315547E|nr:CPBP family glutamic-type intramembrane protease [Arsenicitalea aurantiaca]
MTASQRGLVLHAVLAIGCLCLAVPFLTTVFGGPVGYLLSLGLYWLGFCVPVVFLHLGGRLARLYDPRLATAQSWVAVVLGLQVALVFAAGLLPNIGTIPLEAFALALLLALVNAPLEEAAWRGGFLELFADRPVLGFWLCWALFTAWHVPLALAHGIAYEGGWPALVGGAAGLGLIWSAIAWRTGSIFWVSIAHLFTNLVTFPVLIARNGFV